MPTAIAPEQMRLMRGHERSCPECAGIGTSEWFDGFAGAGGSSLGLEAVRCPACGRSLIRVVAALNHDHLAVEAHNENFPHADHDVHDIQDVHPSRFPRTQGAWFSPDCGHHAYCRGKRSVDDAGRRARMTFFDIVRFTEYHRYDAVIVENVIEARLWCDTLAHPEKCSCGSHFDTWRASMELLGYQSQIVFFNSQFALPTPQSRDRMYVVFWRNGLPTPPLDFRPVSWCSACETVVRGVQVWKPASKNGVRAQPGKNEWGRYGTQYLYRCPDCNAAVAPAVTGARTIIDPTIPIERIGDRAKDLAPNTRERIKHGWQRLQGTEPIVVQVGGNMYERRPGVRVWSVDAPMRTLTATNEKALVVRVGGQNGVGRGLDEPMQTVIASDRQVGLVIPNRAHAVGAGLDEPAGTVTTAPAQHMLVQVNRGKPGDRNPSTLEEPTRTVAGHGELALVSMRNHGDAAPVAVPAHTVVAGGLHHGLLVYNGVPGFVRDLDDAAGTLTARDKQSLLIPYYSTGVAHPVGEPMGTITTKDRQALVITEADIDDCYFRMLQWPELLKAQQMHMHGDGSAYRLTARRKVRGKMVELSNEQRVRMIGMAVSSPVATMLGHAVIETLRGAA